MFDPDGWLPIHYVVSWLAALGREGKLPRSLGFVHPGDEITALDLSAEATARHVLGEKLTAGTLTGVMFVVPANRWLELQRSDYWTSDSAAKTMETSRIDLSFFKLDNVQVATFYLKLDAVTAALGLRLVSPEAADKAKSAEAVAAAKAKSTAEVAAADKQKPKKRPAKLLTLTVNALLSMHQTREIDILSLPHADLLLKQVVTKTGCSISRSTLERALTKIRSHLDT